MGRINPSLPTVGGDEDTWGDETNGVFGAVLGQGNDQEDRIVVLELDGASAKIRLSAAEGGIRYLQTLVTNITGGSATAPLLGIDDDGTPYYVVPVPGQAFLTEQGDRFVLESGDTWLVD